ncbi:MAG: phage head-tail connector protein [Chloroflexi bacterium]|nr:phage head-tail connector protein [Chloroflexota bacterium]
MAHLVLETAPSIEPLVRDTTVKDHLRITQTDENDLLDRLIQAAREHLEDDTRRAVITQTWNLYLDAFPSSSATPILLPLPALQSVGGDGGGFIKYYDQNNVLQTWSTDDYQVSITSLPGRILPAHGEVWPTTYGILDAVQIQFVCGYGDAVTDVPEKLRQAMLLLIGSMYENRESEVLTREKLVVLRGEAAYTRLIMAERVWM